MLTHSVQYDVSIWLDLRIDGSQHPWRQKPESLWAKTTPTQSSIPFLFQGQGSRAPKPELHAFAASDEAWDCGFMHQAPGLVPFPLWFDCFVVWERLTPVYVHVCLGSFVYFKDL